MTIKELRDNIDKIDDKSLENLLRDFYSFEKNARDFSHGRFKILEHMEVCL